MSQSRREVLRRQQEAQAKAKRLNRIVLVGAIVVAAVVVAVFGVILAQQWGGNNASAGGNPPNATKTADGIVVNPGKAAAGAPVVELFVDYQCPVCKEFETANGALFKELADSGKIQLIYRTMTFLDNNLRNDSSTKAAIAAACSDKVGAYPAFHDAIFANQPAVEGVGYTTEQLRVLIPGIAGVAGDKLGTFQQCYDTKATAAFVRGTNELASKDGVTGTPSLRINGKVIPFQQFASLGSDQLKALLLAG